MQVCMLGKALPKHQSLPRPIPLGRRGWVGELLALFGVFLRLGLTSFGGPVAHVGYLREEFVRRRQWLDDQAFGDLVALCQFLPGPSSSQLVFALGMRRAKLAGGLVASVAFTLPAAVLMIIFGIAVASLGHLEAVGWLQGVKLAAVAVVAQAVWGMGRNLCTNQFDISVALGAAAVMLCVQQVFVQIAVIFLGGLLGWWRYGRILSGSELQMTAGWRGHRIAVMMLGAYLFLLILMPVLAALTGNQQIAVFDSFYRSGALVFGGGHVVLPLLRLEMLAHHWVSNPVFLAGYGAAQALPGPLFTISAYLGTVIQPGPGAAWRGVVSLVAIFLPGLLLIGGMMPFWNYLRTKAWARAALRGANASVVGMLLAALYNPLWTESVSRPMDLAAVLIAFGLLQWWKSPPWLLVMLFAGWGAWRP